MNWICLTSGDLLLALCKDVDSLFNPDRVFAENEEADVEYEDSCHEVLDSNAEDLA